ncbi:MAG: hypothetical protein ACOC8D_00175 [bacterium]
MIRLRELWVDGFGCLRAPDQPFRFDDQRITLFLDDNEAGKTTLQMALLASLYGIETDKRLLRTSLRPHGTHWFPLAGPPFATRLRLHDGRRLLEVRWDFTNAGEAHVVDLETNQEVTEELCPGGDGLLLGRRLLELSIGEFSKTCLVCQDDLSSVGRAAGLDSLVQRAADSAAGDATVARALTVLRETLRNYPEVVMLKGGNIDNEIKRLEEEAEELDQRLDELEAERQAIADQDAEFQRLIHERDELRAEEARLEYLAQIAEHAELEARIAKAREAQATLADYEAELQQVAHLEGFPAQHADALTRWQAERLEVLRQAEQAEKSAAELQANALDPTRRDLEEQGRLAAIDQDDADALAVLLGTVKSFEAEEDELAEAIRREEERLEIEGASIEELDRLEQRFRELEAEDGGFILDHERASAQAAAELAEARAGAEQAQSRADRVVEDRQEARAAARQWVIRGAAVAGAGVLIGAVAMVWLLGLGVGVLVVVGGAGAALALKGHRNAMAAEVLGADELAAARSEKAQLDERAETLAAEQRERDARLKDLARRYGYEQPEVLAEDYSALDELRRLCGDLIHMRAQQRALAERRQAVEAKVDAAFANYGEERPQSDRLSAAVEGLQSRMNRSLQLQQRAAQLERQVANEEQRHAQLRQRATELTATIRGVLVEAGLPESVGIDEGIEEFDRRLKGYQRLRQLVDRDIPSTRAHAVEEETIEAWEADLQRLRRAIATQREERPGLLSVEATETATEYRRHLAEIREQAQERDDQAHQVGTRVVAILDRYHAERPALLEAIAQRRRQATRARVHRQALSLAVEQLDAVGHEVHGRWASELNRTTSQLLERIAPTLSDLKFDSRLHFGVWHQGGDTPVRSTEASPILSAGTWDQLYLAVRLGIADFIAQRGSGGLLLLDDPFAHFDDPRFDNAMRVLADLEAQQHQVVIFSCQCQRFKWLRENDPEWFDAHVASRRIGPAVKEPL